jgi:hypothetical protein
LYSFCKMKTHTFFWRISFWKLMDASNFDAKMCAPLLELYMWPKLFFSNNLCTISIFFFRKKQLFYVLDNTFVLNTFVILWITIGVHMYDNTLTTNIFSKLFYYPPLAQACPKQAIQIFSSAFHTKV